ncbi:U-box domain-containing protein 5 isoform X3 [Ricinus communis]|uniref:U-box domain-containing protein 5 isoform X3 n=1 Tax=Ricinus communis TaxID=3988 RepID=UPI00201ADAC4|nr:U-box domain-containing protein 5 isoform X3 [Ricinus communis]XP_048227433.1 U-box domain-containing protein 5 isoform X3 [Ricinus communis]
MSNGRRTRNLYLSNCKLKTKWKRTNRNFHITVLLRLMCLELKNFIDRISRIFSEIESARPRCATGLQALCSLHAAMDKAKLLIQHCTDSSKLYLAFTADKILSRCENIRKTLDLCLIQIQNMVPTLLAAKLQKSYLAAISGIIEDLRGTKFMIQPSEVEAGKVVKELLKLDMPTSDSINDSELVALLFAAVRLKITSPLAVLMEKRSIMKLHGKIRETDPRKKILVYLLYLLRKYEGLLGQHKVEDGFALQEEYKTQTENSATPEPPLEFKCPISNRLMYDPVLIATGKTFERVWIEKWFQEGKSTCPVTNMRLENCYLTPNLALKGLISKWCSNSGITISEPCAGISPAPVSLLKSLSFRSIASIGSSMNDLHLQVSNISLSSSDTNFGADLLDDYNNADSGGLPQKNAGSCTSRSSIKDISIGFTSLSKLDSLPWESQSKAVHDIKEQLNENEKAYDCMFDNSFIKPLINFLLGAYDSNDVQAQNDAAEVLLSILSKSRIELPSIDKDAICMLASPVDSEIPGKALAIMEELSCQPFYKSRILACGVLPAILKVLEWQDAENCKLAVKIICNLSYNSDIAYHIVYLDCILKLVPFLGDRSLAGYCLGIMNNLCSIEEGRITIAGTASCIALIATLVETGTRQEQETATEVLHSICKEHAGRCQQVIRDSTVQSLFRMSVSEISRSKDIATELLQLLGYKTESHVSDSSDMSIAISSPKDTRSPSTGFAYFGKKIPRFFN